MPPGIIVDGVTYYKSSWDTAVRVLPAGFTYGGVVDSATADGATVYINENNDQVVYVSISWHTATDEEGKETLHNGYDVFVRRS